MASYRQKKKNIKKKLAAGQALTKSEINFVIKKRKQAMASYVVKEISKILVDVVDIISEGITNAVNYIVDEIKAINQSNNK